MSRLREWHLECDFCGVKYVFDTVREARRAGWKSYGAEDACPTCAERARGPFDRAVGYSLSRVQYERINLSTKVDS